MRQPLGARLMLGLYGLAWRAALPGLRRNKRLRQGWEQRTLAAGPPPRADVWIQAASGGESYLTWELLAALSRRDDVGPISALCTTFTSQGLGILERARAALAGRVTVIPAYVPFDLPGRVERALSAVDPRVVVLLETELWPGLLTACRRRGVPALVVNARMTEKSLNGYMRLPGFWRSFSPARVLAVSEADAARFVKVFPGAAVSRMPNIKFDRLDFAAKAPDATLAGLIPAGAPFVVLGSVRRQEEEQALRIVRGLLDRLPGVVVGLFPRHMERIHAWRSMLAEAGVSFVMRGGGDPAKPGSVVLWDVFGEQAAAFALCRACFIGGSLADLGGQNFLEPLAHGVTPVIGPAWSNFAWVGGEIFAAGIVRRRDDWRGVLDELCALAGNPPDREAVRRAARDYAAPRRGGSDMAAAALAAGGLGASTVAERPVSG